MIEIVVICVFCKTEKISVSVPESTEHFTIWQTMICDKCNRKLEEENGKEMDIAEEEEEEEEEELKI